MCLVIKCNNIVDCEAGGFCILSLVFVALLSSYSSWTCNVVTMVVTLLLSVHILYAVICPTKLHNTVDFLVDGGFSIRKHDKASA